MKKETTARRPKPAPAGPAQDQAYLNRATARQAKGDHSGAIEDFTKAIEVNPECAKAYAGRGVSRERQGDAAGARADYGKSIGIEILAEINRQMGQQS